MRRIIFLFAFGLIATIASAQLVVDTMASTYYKESIGGYRFMVPTSVLDATPTDDTIYYYWPVQLHSKLTYYGTIALDTTAGNLGANAGTFVWQQSSTLHPSQTSVKEWKNIGNAAALPATATSSTFSGTVDGLRLRLLVLLTAGNAAIKVDNVLKK